MFLLHTALVCATTLSYSPLFKPKMILLKIKIILIAPTVFIRSLSLVFASSCGPPTLLKQINKYLTSLSNVQLIVFEIFLIKAKENH